MEPSHDKPEPELPVLDYAAARPLDLSRKWWPALVSILLTVLVAPMFVCACGHLAKGATLVTLPACVLACYGWIGNKNGNLAWRVFLMGVVVLSTMVFLKNAGDILWFGHDPLLRWGEV